MGGCISILEEMRLNNIMRGLFQKIEEKAKKIDFAVVSVAAVISAAWSFLFSIVARRYIPPYEYGIYSTCLLLQTYLSYAQLGVLSAYNRDYPQLIGAGKNDIAKELKNTAFTFFIVIYVLLTTVIGIFLYLIYLKEIIKTQYFIGYLLSMILLIGNTVSDFGTNTMQMNGNYNFTALVTVIKSTIGAIAGFIAVRAGGYYGLYIMPAVSGMTAILMYRNRSLRGIHLRMNRNLLKEAVWTGFPLMANSLVWTAVASVDKFVILKFLDTEALGLYSVAQLGFAATVLIPQSMSQVFYIKISREYGKLGDKNLLIKTCNRYTLINSLCTSVVCVMGFYILPIFVKTVMPQYGSGIEAAQIMLIGITIYGSTMLYGNIFSILKENRDLLWTSIALCFFNILFSTGLVMIFGRNIENVALGTAISYAAFSILLMYKVSQRTGENSLYLLQNSWKIIFIIVLPTVTLYYVFPDIYISFTFVIGYIFIVSMAVMKRFKKNH